MHPATINAVSGTIQLIRQALVNIEQIMASDPSAQTRNKLLVDETESGSLLCTTKEEEALTRWVEKQFEGEPVSE